MAPAHSRVIISNSADKESLGRSLQRFRNSRFLGAFSVVGGCVGGLAGYNDAGPITNCYATGSVSGDNRVGDLMTFCEQWLIGR